MAPKREKPKNKKPKEPQTEGTSMDIEPKEPKRHVYSDTSSHIGLLNSPY